MYYVLTLKTWLVVTGGGPGFRCSLNLQESTFEARVPIFWREGVMIDEG